MEELSKLPIDVQLLCLARAGRSDVLCRLHKILTGAVKVQDAALIATALIHSNGTIQGLKRAAEHGLDGVVRILFPRILFRRDRESPGVAFALRRYLQDVLCLAAEAGHDDVVRTILGWPDVPDMHLVDRHPLLACAARAGHDRVVRTVLEWAKDQTLDMGHALAMAAHGGHDAVVRTLLGWPRQAPRADVADGWALVLAIHGSHEAVVRTLLDWPVHPADPDCQEGWAKTLASMKGHTRILELLHRHPLL